jgi:hypothetical protein
MSDECTCDRVANGCLIHPEGPRSEIDFAAVEKRITAGPVMPVFTPNQATQERKALLQSLQRQGVEINRLDAPCGQTDCVDGVLYSDSMSVLGVHGGYVAYGKCPLCNAPEVDETPPELYTRLEILLAEHEAKLYKELNKAVIKQRIYGQIDALEWVMQQIDALRDEIEEPIPLVPTDPDRFRRQGHEKNPFAQEWQTQPAPPQHAHPVQPTLDPWGLNTRQMEDFSVTSSDGASIYVRKDGKWVTVPVARNSLGIINEERQPIGVEALRRLKAAWSAEDFKAPFNTKRSTKFTDLTES